MLGGGGSGVSTKSNIDRPITARSRHCRLGVISHGALTPAPGTHRSRCTNSQAQAPWELQHQIGRAALCRSYRHPSELVPREASVYAAEKHSNPLLDPLKMRASRASRTNARAPATQMQSIPGQTPPGVPEPTPRHNSFQLGPSRIGIFVPPTMCNHHCLPSARYAFERADDGAEAIVLRALRPIAAGEDVTISYIDHILPRLPRRTSVASGWMFYCRCSACQPEAGASERCTAAPWARPGGLHINSWARSWARPVLFC